MLQVTLDRFREETKQYAQPTPFEVFKDLEASGYLSGCKRDLLFLLWDLKPHNVSEVSLAGGKQYNARILELRRDGWQIVNERSLQPVKSFYRLINKNRR